MEVKNTGMRRNQLMVMSANREVYGSMPDGSTPDYNRIFDVIDEVFGTSKIEYSDAERFMWQFKDAARNYEMVRNRYDFIAAPLDCDETPFRKDPTARLPLILKNSHELSSFEKIMLGAEKDYVRARRIVGDKIYSLPDEKQRMVMTAHYLCFTDWKIISRVYGHQDRWAKDVHVTAMEEIDQLLMENIPEEDLVGDFEIEDMIFQWKTDEFDWKRWEKGKEERLRKKEDLRLMVGLAPVIPKRTIRELSKK